MKHEDKELPDSELISYPSASHPLCLRQDKSEDPQTTLYMYFTFHRMKANITAVVDSESDRWDLDTLPLQAGDWS